MVWTVVSPVCLTDHVSTCLVTRSTRKGASSPSHPVTDQLHAVAHQSHTAGFEAWMRARGDAANQVFTTESAAEMFGVVKSSYEGVPLPPIKAYTAQVGF